MHVASVGPATLAALPALCKLNLIVVIFYCTVFYVLCIHNLVLKRVIALKSSQESALLVMHAAQGVRATLVALLALLLPIAPATLK